MPKRAKSAGRRTMIEEALRALDRSDQAAAIIAAEGLTFTTATTRAVRVHPAVKIERESRQLFARLWSSMHLEWSYREDG